MAGSTVPPPPAAPEGDAGGPIPGTAPAPSAAKKPTAARSTAKKPAAATSAAKKPAAATSTAAVSAVSAPAAVEAAVEPDRPNPYAAPPAVTPPGATPSPYAGAPVAQPATLSVLSLVFGVIGLVLSLFLVGLLPAIAAVILGHLALKREPHARGMAVGGLVTGYVGVAISVLWALIILVPIVLVWIAVGAVGVTGGLTGGF